VGSDFFIIPNFMFLGGARGNNESMILNVRK